MDFLRKHLATPRAALWSCFALNFLNYLDRQIPYALSGQLKTEFALADVQVGQLASAFLLVYSAAAVPLGLLSDRWQRRKMLALCAILWSLATAAGAFTKNFGALLFFRALVGIGEAGYAAAAPALLAGLFPKEKRARVFSIFYIAIPAGSAAGYVAGGLLGSWVGWRGAFALAGLSGLALAPLLLFLKETPAAPHEDTGFERFGTAWKALLQNRLYWLIVIGEIGMSFSLGGVVVWFPAHLSRTFGYGEAAAGILAGAVVAAPSLAGSLAGGYLVGAKARTKNLLLVPAAGFGAGALLAAWHFHLTAPALALPVVLAGIAVIFLYPGPLQEALARQVSPRIRASAFSLEILLIHVLGDVWSPPLIGNTSDTLQAGGLSPGAALAASLSWWVPVPLLLAAGALFLAARLAKDEAPPPPPKAGEKA